MLALALAVVCSHLLLPPRRGLCRVVVVLEAQGDVSWEVPPGAPSGLPLFETGSAHMRKDSLTFLGGMHGWSLTFKVFIRPRSVLHCLIARYCSL